jgi:hypothetical protein
MLAERKLSLDRLRQLEQASQQLNVAHESLDKTKAELIAVRAERDATVCVVFNSCCLELRMVLNRHCVGCTAGEQTESGNRSSEQPTERQ